MLGDDDDDDDDLFDFAEGKRRRDEGIERVTDHSENWVKETADQVQLMIPDVWEGTSDHVRILLARIDWPGPPPGKANAWGALMNSLVRRQVFRHTGRSTKTLRAAGHARRLPIYRRGPA